MGQKANPNSFQLPSKTTFFSGNTFNMLEYSTLFKEQYIVSSNLTTFFEKVWQEVVLSFMVKKIPLKESFLVCLSSVCN